jgi:hypothetical protein
LECSAGRRIPMTTRLMAISVVVLSFCACGPGAKISGGKQGAAEALFAASSVTKGGTPAGSGIDLTGSISVACPEGGSASLHNFSLITNTLGGGANVGESFTADYNNCGVKTDLGTSVIKGSVSVDQTIAVTSGSTNIDQTIKGKLEMGGATSDFLDIDISQKIAVSALTQTSGGVSMTLKGSLKDTEGSWTYDEAVSVTPGKITVTVEAAGKK